MLSSHLTAAFIFAAVTSIVFAITSKDTDRERVLYGLRVFGVFLAVSVVAAWLMYFIHR